MQKAFERKTINNMQSKNFNFYEAENLQFSGYNLELEKAEKQIKALEKQSFSKSRKSKDVSLQTKAKLVCIQLPDGLKPKAVEIADQLEKNTNAKILIWADTCFGSCDIPELKDIDLLIHFGHSRWGE